MKFKPRCAQAHSEFSTLNINNCWFSVSRHSKQMKIKIKKKEGKHVKTLVKIQVTAIFLMEDMRRNVSLKLLGYVWRRHVGAHPDGHQQKTSVTEFCYKSVNSSVEELKHATIIFFSNTGAAQIAKFPEISHFLNQHDSSLCRHKRATSRKSFEIQV